MDADHLLSLRSTFGPKGKSRSLSIPEIMGWGRQSPLALPYMTQRTLYEGSRLIRLIEPLTSFVSISTIHFPGKTHPLSFLGPKVSQSNITLNRYQKAKYLASIQTTPSISWACTGISVQNSRASYRLDSPEN